MSEPPATTACIACGTRLRSDPEQHEWTYVRCPQCGLLSSVPLPSEDEIEVHYQRKFREGNYELNRRYAAQYRRVHEQLANWMTTAPEERVLDVGCFTGDLLEILRDRGLDIYGLELQPEAVELANARLGGRVFLADVNGTHFPVGPYDIITMMGLVEHVLDPRGLLRRARELLSPGGRLYLQTPNADSVVARAMGSIWPPRAPVEHVYLFGARSLTRVLEDEGFEDVRVRAHVKHLPVNYIYEQFANFGGSGWQRVFKPARLLLGDATLPFYVGEMFVSAAASTRTTSSG